MFSPENFDKRSQDLPEAMHDAAQFYWAKPETWIKYPYIFNERSTSISIPRWRVQDIDTPQDWKMAEILFGLAKYR